MRGFGSQSSANFVIRAQVIASFWLRRLSTRRQRLVISSRNVCECRTVGRHCVVVEVAGNDLPQPFPLLRDRLMHAPSQLLLDLPKLRPHAVAPGLPLDEELALAGLAADEGEAQEVEGLRFAEPTLGAPARRMAAELDQPGLVRMQ